MNMAEHGRPTVCYGPLSTRIQPFTLREFCTYAELTLSCIGLGLAHTEVWDHTRHERQLGLIQVLSYQLGPTASLTDQGGEGRSRVENTGHKPCERIHCLQIDHWAKGLGGPSDTTYVDKALSKAGVTRIARSQSLATSDEIESFDELAQLESVQKDADDDYDDDCD